MIERVSQRERVKERERERARENNQHCLKRKLTFHTRNVSALGGCPRRRPSRRRASPAPFFLADCGGLSVGWDPVGRDRLGGERGVGGVLVQGLGFRY